MNRPRLSPVAAALVAALAAVLSVAAPARAGVRMNTADGPVRVNDWGYVLQGRGDAELSPDALAAAPYGLLVTDYSRDGTGARKFTRTQVRHIRTSDPASGGNGRRRVLAAYVSVGEASEFRDNWSRAWTKNGRADSPLTDKAPSFLGPVNPDWTESRKVRFWQPAWRDLMFNARRTGYVDQIVGQGFDAAYLDIVDAYYYWGAEVPKADRRKGDPTGERDSARRMLRFVIDLTAHARERRPNFYVVPQNGEFVLDDADLTGPGDAALRTAYLASIGGIAVEDTYFRGDRDENNALRPDRDKIAVLKRDYLAAGKPVFAVDYVSDPAKVRAFQDRAAADGFLPFAAPRRDLDVIPAGGQARAAMFFAAPVPEPASAAVGGLGAAGLLLGRRVRRVY